MASMRKYVTTFLLVVLGIIFVGSAYFLLNPLIPKKTELNFVLDEAHLTGEDEIPKWVEGAFNWSGGAVFNCPHDGSKLVEIPHVIFGWYPEIDYSAFYCRAEKIFYVVRFDLNAPYNVWWGPFVCESTRFRDSLAKVSLFLSGIGIVVTVYYVYSRKIYQ